MAGKRPGFNPTTRDTMGSSKTRPPIVEGKGGRTPAGRGMGPPATVRRDAISGKRGVREGGKDKKSPVPRAPPRGGIGSGPDRYSPRKAAAGEKAGVKATVKAGPFHRAEEGPQERGDRLQRWMSEGKSFFFDFLGAVLVLLIIIGALYTYTGNWPPLVVVQSGSMMHGTDESQIGSIDTGDLVFVKDLGERDPIVTYVEGNKSGHRSYGSYGDVIIFRPDGDGDRTAIIHRAVVYIEYNETSGGYNVPSMGLVDRRDPIRIPAYEWPENMTLTIDLRTIFEEFKNRGMEPHSGYITKGDNNGIVDQNSRFGMDQESLLPVKTEWVLGKSVGELPWFGVIKLYLEDKGDIPKNSIRNLAIAVGLIIIIPFLIDGTLHVISKVRGPDEEPLPEEGPAVDHRRRAGPPPVPRKR